MNAERTYYSLCAEVHCPRSSCSGRTVNEDTHVTEKLVVANSIIMAGIYQFENIYHGLSPEIGSTLNSCLTLRYSELV